MGDVYLDQSRTGCHLAALLNDFFYLLYHLSHRTHPRLTLKHQCTQPAPPGLHKHLLWKFSDGHGPSLLGVIMNSSVPSPYLHNPRSTSERCFSRIFGWQVQRIASRFLTVLRKDESIENPNKKWTHSLHGWILWPSQSLQIYIKTLLHTWSSVQILYQETAI